MTISATDTKEAHAVRVTVSDDTLSVDLEDGRTLAVPLGWYPRLSHAIEKERADWRLIGRGSGIHWPEIDEDISVAGLLAGNRSGESPSSLGRWLERRAAKPEP